MNFIQSSLAAKAFISCPNELRTRKFIYVRFQPLFIYSIQSIHAETLHVGAVNTRRFNSGYTFSISFNPLLFRRNRSLVKSTSGFARSHSRFTFDHVQEYSSHYRRKIRALYAKVHLNLEKSTTVIQFCLRALVINWQLIDLLQFTQGISIIEKIIHYSFYKFIMTFTL